MLFLQLIELFNGKNKCMYENRRENVNTLYKINILENKNISHFYQQLILKIIKLFTLVFTLRFFVITKKKNKVTEA